MAEIATLSKLKANTNVRKHFNSEINRWISDARRVSQRVKNPWRDRLQLKHKFPFRIYLPRNLRPKNAYIECLYRQQFYEKSTAPSELLLSKFERTVYRLEFTFFCDRSATSSFLNHSTLSLHLGYIHVVSLLLLPLEATTVSIKWKWFTIRETILGKIVWFQRVSFSILLTPF